MSTGTVSGGTTGGFSEWKSTVEPAELLTQFTSAATLTRITDMFSTTNAAFGGIKDLKFNAYKSQVVSGTNYKIKYACTSVASGEVIKIKVTAY